MSEVSVPCRICDQPTVLTGTKLCAACWNFQRNVPQELTDLTRSLLKTRVIGGIKDDRFHLVPYDLMKKLYGFWERVDGE